MCFGGSDDDDNDNETDGTPQVSTNSKAKPSETAPPRPEDFTDYNGKFTGENGRPLSDAEIADLNQQYRDEAGMPSTVRGVTSSVRPQLRPSSVGSSSNSSNSMANSNDNSSSDRDAAIAAELAKKGYSDNYKGVTGAVGRNGEPLLSGTYAQTRDTITRDYDNKVAYDAAYKTAKANWDKSNTGLPFIDQDLINVGMGKGGYLLEGFDPTNAQMGIGPPTPESQEAATKMLALLMRNKYGGGTKYSFPGASFDDPLGNALGSTLKETFTGSGYNNRTNQSSFDALADAYNKPFRRNLASDAAGNVGTNTFGQRFGTGLGNLIEGLVAGSVLGPVGSMFATGTQYENMNTYGPRVPGWEGTASTASFDYGNALGGILGDFVAGKAAPYVGQKIYDSTGDVNKAMMGAVATGVTATEGVGAYVGGKMQDVAPGIMSSDIKTPYEARSQQQKNQEEAGGFGASLGQGEGNKSVATKQPALAPAMSTMQNTGLSDSATDLASGRPDFDYELWLKMNAQRANPNSGQPVDLAGAPTMSASNNPLFNAQPDLNGVRYLQSAGTNRNYGTAMMQPINSMQQSRSTRRVGLNDRRVGVVIG